MGHRLSKIYTRTGDKGSTGLGDGSRVEKDHPLVEAFGTVDELNSCIGLLRAHQLPAEMDEALGEIQHDLFDLGGELSIPGHRVMQTAHVTRLERLLDHYNAALPMLKEFILPGGGMAAAQCHLARAVCRRAERRLHSAARAHPVNSEAVAYLNRLSDLLFVLARSLNRFENAPEVLWQPHRYRKEPLD